MRESHAEHKPLAYFRPKHKLTEEFGELAARLMGAEATTQARKTAKPSRAKEKEEVL
jgi:hypothetical protein